MVVGPDKINVINVSKNENLIIGKIGRNKVKRGLESQGEQERPQGVALEDNHGDVKKITVTSCCGVNVGVKGVEVSNKVRIGELV